MVAFTEALGRFAHYSNRKITKKYFFVFEPSWWGYQNQLFLMYLNIGTEIIIQAPYEKDYRFVKSLNHCFHPSRLGAGDWVDSEKFTDGKKLNKNYDIAMVGNWGKAKRHYLLFQAVKKMKTKAKIALIGYPSKNRRLQEVIHEAKICGIYKQCEFFENITPDEVANILRHSKVNVLLSKGEGANRGIYEGIFCGNVIVVYYNITGCKPAQHK